jgi:hypothetical protein
MKGLRTRSLIPLLAVTAAACGARSPTGENSQAIFNPNLHVVDAAASVEVAPDSLVFHAPLADEIQTLGPGAILVSAAGQGYLRRVTSVSRSGDTLVMSTQPAALEDAVIEGEAHSSMVLTPRGVGTESTIDITPINYTFGNTGISASPDLQLTLNNGNVAFNPILDLDLEVHGGKVTKFQAVLHANLDAQVDVQIAAIGRVSASYSQTLAQTPPIVLVQWIGWVPVVETVNLSLSATGSAHANGTATLNLGTVSAHADLTAGASYDGAKWTPVFHPNASFGSSPSVSGAVNAGLELSLDLRGQVLLYGVVGPYIDVGPYVQETLTAPPPSASGRVGLQGSFGGEVSILGNTVAQYSTQLFDVGRNF